MANMIDMSKEFGYHISAFHHAVEAYKIADLLRDNDICAVMWADWYGFKMEAYDAIKENIPLVHNAGACAMVHSDDPNGIQRLNQEVAKALADGRRAGITVPDEVAWEWLSRNPAKALGILDKTGTLTAGKLADVVLWNGCARRRVAADPQWHGGGPQRPHRCRRRRADEAARRHAGNRRDRQMGDSRDRRRLHPPRPCGSRPFRRRLRRHQGRRAVQRR